MRGNFFILFSHKQIHWFFKILCLEILKTVKNSKHEFLPFIFAKIFVLKNLHVENALIFIKFALLINC